MSIPIRRRSLGENISLVFSLIIRNFGRLFLVSAVFTIPALIPMILAGMDPEAWTSFDGLGDPVNDAEGVAALLVMLFFPMMIGSIIGIVSGSYTGERVSVGRSLAIAGRKFLSLAMFGILLYVLLIVIWVPAAAVMVAVAASSATIVLLMISMSIVTMFIFFTFYVGMPAIVVEDIGCFPAFSRSMELTKGHRLGIFFFMAVLGIVSWLLILVFSIPLGIITIAAGEGGAGGIVVALVTWIWTAIISLTFLIAPVVVYFQLRAVKEDFQLNTVADLVDRIAQRRIPRDT